ncbi:HAD family hydrolase [Cytobacillus sp. BC1816]|uniref:HAD family hydrolase n=1 Tax=Cytobacillus sp. BC1816 TaxID=3440154 RepID=UPI003F51331E
MILTGYDIVIFDCDGVLVDSNKKKSDAFIDVISDYPVELVTKFIEYHKNNGGISRYKKFEYFITNILNENFNEELYNSFLQQYSHLSRELYKEVELTPGTLALLKKLAKERKDTFIASGSDEKELNEAFESKGIKKYFNKIYGSPTSKEVIIKNIKNKYSSGKNFVLIGDSYKDFEAAFLNKIDFIYMGQFSEQSIELKEKSQQNAIFVVNNLEELLLKEVPIDV